MERSEKIGELIAALTLARKDFKPIVRATTNEYFDRKYAELVDYIDATKDALTANGLSIVQAADYNPENTTVLLTTLLVHTSEQWLENLLLIPVSPRERKKRHDDEERPHPNEAQRKPDAQSIGGAITYGRRYAYCAMLSIAAKGEDDDGNAAAGRSQEQSRDWGTSTETDAKKGRNLNKQQLAAFWSSVKQSGRPNEQVRAYLKEKYDIEHSTDIPKKELSSVIKWVLSDADREAPPEAKQRDEFDQREPGEDDEPPKGVELKDWES